MKNYLFLFAIIAFTASSCADIITRPMHRPLYPDQDEAVTITMDAESAGGLKEIKLFETVATINSSGTITSTGTEVEVGSWSMTGGPTNHSESYTKSGGYGSNKLVTYRFVVKNNDRRSRTHTVTFATRPYPLTNHPAPVYCQGDVDDVFDLVFIPDEDISDLDNFRDQCANLISNTIHREPTLTVLNRQFNFYINPISGDAVPFGEGSHVLPSNNANLSFAEARALLHQTVFRDFAQGGVFSMEVDRPQTLLHENGHAMFNLADEYGNGVHWEESLLPNNWNNLSDAQADAPSRSKTAADAVEMGTSNRYKLCGPNCPMISGPALLFDYDSPCSGRVLHLIFDNAIN